MPVFEIEAGGKMYEVEAPDQQAALGALQQMQGGGQQQSTGGYVDNLVRQAANSIPVIGGTLNKVEAARRASGALFDERDFSQEYDRELKAQNQQDEQFQQQNPKAALAAQVGGAVLGTAPLVAAAPAAFGAGGGSLLARSVASGASGAALGGADAAVRSGGDAEAIEQGAKMGAGAGLVGPALAAGAGALTRKVVERVRPPKGVPTAEELDEAAKAAYQRADAAGLVIRGEGVQRMNKEIIEDLTEAAAHPSMQPRVFAALGELQKAEGGNITLKGMDTLRKLVGNAGASVDATERMLASQMKKRIDDFLVALKPNEVLMGDREAGIRALVEARQFYQKARKSQIIQDAIDRAKDRAAASGAGANENNAIRQEINRLMKGKQGRQFTEAEREAMRKIVRGTAGQNAARLVGKAAPTGAVSAAASVLSGGALGGLPGQLAFPMVGQTAKSIADRGTARNAELLDMLIRNGGQLPQSPAAVAAQQQIEGLTRGVLAGAPPVANQQLSGR